VIEHFLPEGSRSVIKSGKGDVEQIFIIGFFHLLDSLIRDKHKQENKNPAAIRLTLAGRVFKKSLTKFASSAFPKKLLKGSSGQLLDLNNSYDTYLKTKSLQEYENQFIFHYRWIGNCCLYATVQKYFL
jgi:hypothetical protein